MRIKKTVEHEGDSDTNSNWCTRDNRKKAGKGTGRLRNKRTGRDLLDYSIINIGQNTEKSPGDLRRLAVTTTPIRKYQLLLAWKTIKGVNNNNNDNKRSYHLKNFAVPVKHIVKERKKKDRQILRSCLRAEKVAEDDSDTIYSCYAWKGDWRNGFGCFMAYQFFI